MALVLKDRVKETSTTAGTGTLTLAGAVTGFQSFSAIGTGNTTYYAIYDAATGAWEVGVGTYTAAGTTLSRDTVLSSSNAGALVSFGPAQKDVFVTYPSSRSVYVNATNTYTVPQAFDTLTANTVTATTATLTNGTITTTPTDGIDLVNKTYVDTLAGTGLTYHAAINLESPNTAGNLTATYTNGGTTPTWTSITGGNTVNTGAAHGLAENDVIVFGTTTNGITAGTAYFVKSVPAATSITLSLARDGAQINTLTNGTGLTITSRANSGVGATLVNAGVQAALVIDGVAAVVGNRVLIYSQTSAFQNGVYTVTSIGSVSTNWILTRATDADKYAPLSINTLGQNDAFYVLSGNTGKGETYVMSTPGTIVFGTTSLAFTQISSAQIYSAGTGLNLSSGTTFNISNTTVAAATYGSASAVPVFAVNAQGQLTSVTNTNIAISGSAVTGNIAGQAGSVANALTAGTYLTSGGTYDGSIARTFTVDATSANTASKVVARDISGNFSAGTITAALSGNATTATTATNIAGGLANQIPFQSAASTTTFAAAPSASNELLSWNGSAFAWTLTPTVTSITLSGGTANGVAYLNGSKVLTTGSALTFDGTNLGIGTTAPTTKLDVKQSGTNWYDGIEVVRSTNDNQRLVLGNTSGASWIASVDAAGGSNNELIFGRSTNGTTFLESARFNTSGNLGIGTTTPANLLEVSATSAGANTFLARFRNAGTTTGTQASLLLTTNTSTGGTASSQISSIAENATGAVALTFGTTPNGSNPTERLRIDSAGNVGIGTTAPAYNLDVRASVAVTSITSSSTTAGNQPTLRFQHSGNNTYQIKGGANLQFLSDDGSNERMRLDTSGNLGIGTTAPTTALYVKRTAGNSEISVDYNGTNVGRLTAASNGNFYIGTSVGAGAVVIGNTANANAVYLDPAGNLGLGVTPSAWGPAGTYIGLQIGPTGGAQVNLAGGDASLGSNFYISAIGVRNYQSTGVGSSRYQFYNGVHSWFNAPSGTAGAAITFTQAMTLDASGNLLVGTTTNTNSYRAVINGDLALRTDTDASGSTTLRLCNSTSLPQGAASVNGTKTAVGAGNLIFSTATGGVLAEKARIDSAGNLLRGLTTAVPTVTRTGVATTPQFQTGGDAQAAGSYGLFNFSLAGSAAYIAFAKSRSGTVGTQTVLVLNDDLGNFNFAGSDGTSFVSSASITAAVDGTPATGSMPGRLTFFTAAAGAAPAERVRITSAGFVGVNQATPGSTLDVKGTLRLSGATSGYVGLAPAAAAGSTTYTLPAADGTAGQVLSTNGTATLSWATVASGSSVTISNDTATSTDIYPLLASATTGTLTASKTSNAKLLYTPSTGEFKSEVVNALGGIFVNSATIDTNYTIAAGNNAGSFGPVTVNAGITVTVSSGSVWTVT